MTKRLTTTQIADAAHFLQNGALVAFPTETVYGLGANACDPLAVARVFAAKGRPSFNPLIVHLPDHDAARRIAVFDEDAQRLAQTFWPGPLSLVLPLKPEAGISDLVTAGLGTVALRVPAHPLAQQLLKATGLPIAAPSANPSGQISPTTAAHVLAGLDGKIAAVLDGGACLVGLESTILATSPVRLLRAGGVTVEQVDRVVGQALRAGTDGAITAPGQLSSHYAPSAGLRLNAEAARAGEFLLGFGPVPAPLNLSPSGDLTEAAANLFSMLRAADARAGRAGIAVCPIPNTGLGLAINDRLSRAAAPR